MFDSECYKLATYFLADTEFDTGDNRDRLARLIQISIEEELAVMEHEAKP